MLEAAAHGAEVNEQTKLHFDAGEGGTKRQDGPANVLYASAHDQAQDPTQSLDPVAMVFWGKAAVFGVVFGGKQISS